MTQKIILGIGSSGPTTKWGYQNYLSLINKLKKPGKISFTYFVAQMIVKMQKKLLKP